MIATWKTVRIFISSTFRDMQAERDHLVRFVLPRLREELLPRRIHLVDIDLRWGVTSGQDALEVCREVIDYCRPRFLCLLGGRYGWVPPGKNRSITADEVHYGILDRTLKDRGFACFYFRDDAATVEMVETVPGEYYEPPGSDNEIRLHELKQAIMNAGLNPFTYPAQWDSERKRLVGLKEFGDLVYNDLLAGMRSDPEIQDRFVMDSTTHLNESAEENAVIEAFVKEHCEHFVLGSRKVVLGELLALANTSGGSGYVCLTGAPGSGKSALLAHFSQHSLFVERPSILLISHFVGASPGSADILRTLRRFCHELKTGCPDITADIPDDPERLRLAFPDFLRQACAKKRIVILLDAIDQFVQATDSVRLPWLPEELPANARVIIPALDSPVLEELRSRHQPHEIELKPLTADDGEAIIEQFLQRYRKQFEPDQRAALLGKTDAGMPLYLLVALEELRTLGTYEEINRRIAELPPTTHRLFNWILERLENDDGFRDAMGRMVGRELVSRFAALLGAARYGLSQRELSDLLDPGDPQGNVAALLHLLRPYLMRRGELLDFYHGQFRAAAKETWLNTDAQRRAAHQSLAECFLGCARGIDPAREWETTAVRGFAECVYHLTITEEYERAAGLLSDFMFLLHKLRAGLLDGIFDDYAVFRREAPKSLAERLGTWSAFFREKAHLLRLGGEAWPAYKIFLQVAVEHADTSPLTIKAEQWLARQKCDWTWLRRRSRPSKAPFQACLGGIAVGDSVIDLAVDAAGSRAIVLTGHYVALHNSVDRWMLIEVDLRSLEVLRSEPMSSEIVRRSPTRSGLWYPTWSRARRADAEAERSRDCWENKPRQGSGTGRGP